MTVLPGDFDFAALNSPSFKEDDVREEIVAPLLRALGYRPTGETRVERGKTLKHPYVMLGTTKRKLTLIPDYVLYRGTRALAVLDAKAPTEEIVGSDHVQQTYSYAIHPEIRCGHFGLCNGHSLIVWEVNTLKPVLQVTAQEINSRWLDLEKTLLPDFLEKPFKRQFNPDFGIAAHVTKLNLKVTALTGFHINMLARLNEATITAMCGADVGGMDFLASFDMPATLLQDLLACLPEDKRMQVTAAMSKMPFYVVLNGKIKIDVGATLGEPTQGEHEHFIPFLVTHLLKSIYVPDAQYPSTMDIPAFVYQL